MDVVLRQPDMTITDIYLPVDLQQPAPAEAPGLPQMDLSELAGGDCLAEDCAPPIDITAPPERGADMVKDGIALPSGAAAVAEAVQRPEATEVIDDDNHVIVHAETGELVSSEEQIKKVIGDENPWEGLDDWAETFDMRSLPVGLNDDNLKHFYVGMDAERPTDTVNWGEALQQGYEATGVEFDGDIDEAARCMAAFERGAKYVVHTLREHGVAIELPPVRIVNDPSIPESEASMAATCDEVLVNGYGLEEASAIPGDEVLTLPPSNTGEPPGMIGTMEEIFFLGGVEEMHHYFFENTHPHHGSYSRDVPHIEYHANEPEYHALRWKLMAARHAGMSPATIGALENTYREATKLRQQARLAEAA
jgi:hypothetical protein